jgi:hypothetical protein
MAIIAKYFFTAKDNRRAGAKILRDHGADQSFPPEKLLQANSG